MPARVSMYSVLDELGSVAFLILATIPSFELIIEASIFVPPISKLRTDFCSNVTPLIE
jgi:hypothetical protein